MFCLTTQDLTPATPPTVILSLSLICPGLPDLSGPVLPFNHLTGVWTTQLSFVVHPVSVASLLRPSRHRCRELMWHIVMQQQKQFIRSIVAIEDTWSMVISNAYRMRGIKKTAFQQFRPDHSALHVAGLPILLGTRRTKGQKA